MSCPAAECPAAESALASTLCAGFLGWGQNGGVEGGSDQVGVRDWGSGMGRLGGASELHAIGLASATVDCMQFTFLSLMQCLWQ